MRVRPAAVAGRFYPDDPDELRSIIEDYLVSARSVRSAQGGERVEQMVRPRAVIVPHAGLVYSGPIAASAYVRLEPYAAEIERVLLIGPAHRVPLDGLALSTADAFATPLGLMPVDRAACAAALEIAGVIAHDGAHRDEHSLEVQVPFLQMVLPHAALLPVLVGRGAAAETVRDLVARFLDGPGWVAVISSDLSHFYPAELCRALDAETSRAIERLADAELNGQRACGYLGIQGLLQVARERSWQAATVDLRNSGDTAGGRESVVGYGAYVVC
jgi:AmmeMemoRadiSam system protein B